MRKYPHKIKIQALVASILLLIQLLVAILIVIMALSLPKTADAITLSQNIDDVPGLVDIIPNEVVVTIRVARLIQKRVCDWKRSQGRRCWIDKFIKTEGGTLAIIQEDNNGKGPVGVYVNDIH